MARAVKTKPKAAPKQYPARKKCSRCGRKRATTPTTEKRAGKFRRLSSGYLQGMCVDCEREADRERWVTRSAASKARRRRAA